MRALTPLGTPEELGIDRHYRLANYSKIASAEFGQHIDGIIQQQILKNPQKKKLYHFLEWALEKNYITSPTFPEIDPASLGYDYYRTLDRTLRDTCASYHQQLVAAAEDYYQHTSIRIPIQQIPKEPSPLWLSVMEGTSIAMGKLKTGVEWDPSTLSSLGVIWRAETIRSLLDSLKTVDQYPAFAAYCACDPQMLPCYFMSVHDEIYTCGKVRFQDLPASDINLLIQAAASQQKSAPCQIILRAQQLLRAVAKGDWDPAYLSALWKNDLSANLNTDYRKTQYGSDLAPEMHCLLEKIYSEDHPCNFDQLGFPPSKINTALRSALESSARQNGAQHGL